MQYQMNVQNITGPLGRLPNEGNARLDCRVVCGIFTWLTTPSVSPLTNIDEMVVS